MSVEIVFCTSIFLENIFNQQTLLLMKKIQSERKDTNFNLFSVEYNKEKKEGI